jgi:hypothetical protein
METEIRARIENAYREFSARAEELERQGLRVATAAAEVVAVWYDAMMAWYNAWEDHSDWGEHLLKALDALVAVEPRLGSTDALWDAYHAYMGEEPDERAGRSAYEARPNLGATWGTYGRATAHGTCRSRPPRRRGRAPTGP